MCRYGSRNGPSAGNSIIEATFAFQVPEAGTDSNVTSKTSLWDLRCELVSLLGSAHGAPTVEVSTGVLQRLKSAMREHVKYRIERRVFEQRRKAAKSSLERQIQSLHASIRRLEATLRREKEQIPTHSSSGPGSHNRINSGTKGRPVMRWVQKMAQSAFDTSQPDASKASSPLKSSMSTARNGITASSSAQQDKDVRKLTKALNHLAEERRKNQILEGENQVLEAKNHVLEARLEELQAQLVELDRRTAGAPPLTPPNAATNNVNNSSAESAPPPQRGWNLFGLWGAQAAEPEPVPEPEALTPESPEIQKEKLQNEIDEWHNVVAELSETKLELAEVQGRLATALRDASRLRDVNSALNAHIDKITEQGFTPLGSDLMTISTVNSGR